MRKMIKRMQDSLYHDLILPDEALEIRAKARDFADRIVAPRAYEIATTEESRYSFPRDVFKALAEEDLFIMSFFSGVLLADCHVGVAFGLELASFLPVGEGGFHRQAVADLEVKL